jgi:hypothetical protein
MGSTQSDLQVSISCNITTRLSRFVPGGRGARESQTMTLYGWVESAPTVQSEFCSNRNVMLRRGGEVSVRTRRIYWNTGRLMS